MQFCPAVFESSDHKRMGRAQRDPETFGNLLQGKAAEPMHLERRPCALRKIGNGRLQGAEVGSSGRRNLRRAIVGNRLDGQFAICNEATCLNDDPAATIDREVSDDAIEVLDRLVD